MDKLTQEYRETIGHLDANYPFFLTHVLNLGSPKWDETIPTAAVGLTRPDGDTAAFEFIFNPEFFSGMKVSERAFVMAHETMHIVLNHLKLGANFVNYKKMAEMQKKQEKGKLTPEETVWVLNEQQNAKRFNIAADCVINDYLANQGMTVLDSAMRGKNVVGYDCAYRTVTEVYDDLQDTEPDQVYVQLDDHSWMVCDSEEEAEAMGKALDALYEDAKAKAGMPADMDERREEMGAGSGLKDGGWMAGKGTGAEEAYREQYGVSFAWTKLLREIDPDFFPEKGYAPPFVPSYHKPRRKLAAFYPQVILPVNRQEERRKGKSDEIPAVCMALDTSGSIPAQMRNTFVALARSIPQDKIKLFACTFEDGYMPLDLDNPKWRSGGTDFSAVERFIRKDVEPVLGHYPKAVIVVTDGQARFDSIKPAPEHEDRWVWILSKGYSNPPNIGRREKLDDYTVRGV